MRNLKPRVAAAALVILGSLSSAVAQTTLKSLNNPGDNVRLSMQSTTISTLRTEFRIEAVAMSASSRYVWGFGEYPIHSCFIPANALVLLCQFGLEGHPNGGTSIDLTGRSDVRVRWQRNPAAATEKIESWNGDCSGYTKVERSVTGALAPFSQSGVVRIADGLRLGFLRWHDTLDNSSACPSDAPPASANLLDLRFENLAGGNTNSDFSGRSQNLNVSGASYVLSAVYDPRAEITGWTSSLPVFRAAEEFILDGSTSIAFAGNGEPSGYFWQQLSGPAPSQFRDRESSSSHIVAPLAGEYVFQLTVKDIAGREGRKNLTVGIVASTPNYVVSTPDEDLAWALGDVSMHGKSPFRWYEATEAAVTDLLRPVMTTPPVETPGPGTLRATVPPNTIDSVGLLTAGSGTGSIVWTGQGTHFTQADVGKRISVRWDADGDGSFRGRHVLYVNSVINETTITTPDYYLLEPPAALSNAGLEWGFLDATFGPYNSTDGNSFIAMFYEAGLAVARLHAKTGMKIYREQFHQFCDNWWRYGLGSGYKVPISRNAGTHAMVACAADPTYSAPPNMWEGIARLTKAMAFYVPTANGNQTAYNPASPIISGHIDGRESSYVLRTSALLARLYGKRTGNFQPWCGYLKNQVNNIWIAGSSSPPGYAPNTYALWGENIFFGNVGYVLASSPAGASNGVFGTSPWRSVGLPALASTYAYEALSDPEACNDPETARKLFDPETGGGLIARAANYVWDFGRSPDGGVYYAEGYESDGGNIAGGTIFNNFPNNGAIQVTQGASQVDGVGTYFLAQYGPCDGSTQIRIRSANYPVASCDSNTRLSLGSPYAGATENWLSDYGSPSTIAVANGSNVIAGEGTNFQSLYAPCDGSTYIGIVGKVNTYVDRRVYQVTSCPSNTSLTINLPYAGPSEIGLSAYSRGVKASSRCGPLSFSTKCEADRYNGRNLSADIAASAAWLFAKTGDENWKRRALYYANKTFGGPAGGSGTLGSPSGSCVYSRTGSLTVTHGSSTVTGSGTQFTRQFGPCNGSTRILVGDAGGSWSTPPAIAPTYYTYAVTSCTDTELTLDGNYEGASRTGTRLFYSPEDPQWNCADGGTGNLGEILPACNVAPAPCGGGSLIPKYGKPLGMASGAGNTPVMIGNLLGGLRRSVNGHVYLEFDLGSVQDAAKVRVTLTQPDGKERSAICEESPCRIPVNLRLGNPLLKFEYLNGDGTKTLAVGEPTVVRFVTDQPEAQLPLQQQPD